MRLDLFTADVCIGATDHSVFDREQSRVRKYRQLCNQQLAYFEPALKIWFPLNNFYPFARFPLQHTSSEHLSALETAFQTTYRPQYNWPWINSLLEVPHWKAEIWTIVHQAVLGSQSEVLSRISETDTHRTNVLLGTRASYI
jgi:hypothetical protein